jgi:hypothetical protein
MPSAAPSMRARWMLVAAVLPLAGLLAGARANVPLDAGAVRSAPHLRQSRLVAAPAMDMPPMIAVGQRDTRFAAVHRVKAQSPQPTPEAAQTSPPAPDRDEAGYNPRALLQNSDVAVVSTIIPVGPDEPQKVNRSAPALLDLRSGDHNSP